MTKKKIELVTIKANVDYVPGKYPLITFECMIFNKEERKKVSQLFDNIENLQNLTFHVEWDEE